ncbi:MAG: hypothetical protein Q8916_05555 [Bacteroidota bacterium]|nr:hypothetical protein [Bacteroidota bacterium]MDP4229856.1 hypothetical protein [Bacteroidota bacterium]MDP4234969.1 hypothetical protein [Bacteroidota bacterium]
MSARSHRWIFRISITLNILLTVVIIFYLSNSPSYELGVLTQDVKVGYLASDSTIYRIPKGITVRDVSERGLGAIGQFENNRFEIIVTTGRSDLVNYHPSRNQLSQFGNYYSADAIPGTAR